MAGQLEGKSRLGHRRRQRHRRGGGADVGRGGRRARADRPAARAAGGRRGAHRASSGGNVHVQPGDLTEPEDVRRIGDHIARAFGRLDILINNAGININDRHWDKLTPENAKLMIDGNLAAAAQCVTVALPLMRRAKGRAHHPHRLDGRPLYRRLSRAALHRGQARHRGDEPLDQHAGMRQRHPLLRLPARRGGDARSSTSAPTRSAPRCAPGWCSPQDCADLDPLYRLLPARLCMNEVMLSPTHNRRYVAEIEKLSSLSGETQMAQTAQPNRKKIMVAGDDVEVRLGVDRGARRCRGRRVRADLSRRPNFISCSKRRAVSAWA